jgi:hypothetical protein
MVGGGQNGRSIFSSACTRTYNNNFLILTTKMVAFGFPASDRAKKT